LKDTKYFVDNKCLFAYLSSVAAVSKLAIKNKIKLKALLV